MTHVELHFPFTGTTLPSDQGYALYSAISRIIPETHSADWLAVETIHGQVMGHGTTLIDSQAKLKIRLPQSYIPLLLKLAGKQLELKGHPIRLGAPQIFLLKPAPALYARIVTIKGFTEADPFLRAVCRKLDEMGIGGEPSVGPRRVVKVGDHKIVGFSVAIHDLSDDNSMALLESGMGGRRRMGCGIFFPVASNRPIGERLRRKQEAGNDQ